MTLESRFFEAAMQPNSTADVTRAVALASRCLCKDGIDDMPCWQCSPVAFDVYWVARYGEPPISLGEIFDVELTAGIVRGTPRVVTWRILCPTKRVADALSTRIQLRVPTRLSYCMKAKLWEAYSHHDRRAAKSLRLALLLYRKGEKMKRR